MDPIRTRVLRAIGVLLGAGLAVFLLVGARPTTSFTSLPARAVLAVGLTGELGVTPSVPRPVLDAKTLEPGAAPARAEAVVRNQTGTTLAVGFRAQAASRDLDGLLRIRLSSGGRVLADTTLQGLRNGTPETLALRAGAETSLVVEAWIPDGITDGYQGRSADVTLAPVVRAQD
jgi:hypothetical protein